MVKGSSRIAFSAIDFIPYCRIRYSRTNRAIGMRGFRLLSATASSLIFFW